MLNLIRSQVKYSEYFKERVNNNIITNNLFYSSELIKFGEYCRHLCLHLIK